MAKMGIKLGAITARGYSLLFLGCSFSRGTLLFCLEHSSYLLQDFSVCAVPFSTSLAWVCLPSSTSFFLTPETALLRYYQFLTEYTDHPYTQSLRRHTKPLKEASLQFHTSSNTLIDFIVLPYSHSLVTHSLPSDLIWSGYYLLSAGNRPLMGCRRCDTG